MLLMAVPIPVAHGFLCDEGPVMDSDSMAQSL